MEKRTIGTTIFFIINDYSIIKYAENGRGVSFFSVAHELLPNHKYDIAFLKLRINICGIARL